MNYYPHHIGDFDKATRHLSRLERSIYRDLLDLYYDTEKPLPLDKDWICRKIIARSNEESTAVEQTLNEFFTETPTGWYHDRCEEEISKYHANNSQKSLAGKASAAAKALKKQQALNGKSTAVERTSNGTPTNPEPITNNQEPLVKRATRIAPDFDPEPEPEAESGIDRQKELANFRDYWSSKARDNTKLDWQATWRQWARKADRPIMSRFAKPDPFITVPGRATPDPELIRLEMESKNATPMPDHIREHIKRIKGQA